MDSGYATAACDVSLRENRAQEEHLQSSHSVDPARIPLVCYSCEKQQSFSDLSHLLTHVSSKAHLLELYNLQVMSQVNRAAAIRCQRFDTWYKTYKISQLVLQRMEARGEKGAQQQRRSQTPKATATGRSASRRSSRGGRGGRGKRGNINPRARNRRVDELAELKYEADEELSFTDGYDGLESPSMQSWQGLNTLMPNGSELDAPPEGVGTLEEENYSSKYATSEGGDSYPSENIAETTEMIEIDAGAQSLKGMVYPGMSLFDAAGEEQKRKRNQRKHPAVLQQLEVNSTLVTTDEIVFDSNLDYQRTRDVYDDPSTGGSEEEDEGDEDSKGKRRVSQARAALNVRKIRQIPVSYDTRSTRVTRAATQTAQRLVPPKDAVASAHSRALDNGGRLARSAVNRGSVSQKELPLHGHGFPGDADLYRDPLGVDNDLGWNMSPTYAGNTPANAEQQILPTLPMQVEDGSESWQDHQSSGVYDELTYDDSQDRLPGLALRPGNPNLSFASPTPSFKRSPSHFLRKENDNLALKSTTASSNPYLQLTNPGHGENYNPLYVQPRDGFGFQMYPSYEEDMKPDTTGFQPINGQSGLNSLHMPSHPNNLFSPNQGGTDFDL
ncbi:hypothetical protein F5Y05DRAFT_420956 [Hypoxylon sp. FL0543]|nr:hypothetical protein F5Y05DRAFT_420956 [Hypoxylon sp. FL0543]